MSVFDLAPRRIGGIEMMARELSRQLGARGWRHILCFKAEPEDGVRAFLQLPNVTICSLERMARWRMECQWRFRRLILQHGPQIVHLNFVDLLSPFAATARLAGADRVFFTDHISRPAGFAPARANLPKRLAYLLASPIAGVFCVSDFVRRCWLEAGVLPADRFVTIYNGIDIDRCETYRNQRATFRRQHGIDDQTAVVAQISSMSLEKGWPTMLNAAKIVLRHNDKVCFVLAGDGALKRKFEELAVELGIRQQVKFVGLLNDPVGEGFFWAADVVCQPSEWQEAFGLSIAEAMACERPVIATETGGIPEIVSHRTSGILVNRGDSKRLAEGILELVASPDLRRQWGAAGKAICRAKFEHTSNAARTIEAYQLDSLS